MLSVDLKSGYRQNPLGRFRCVYLTTASHHARKNCAVEGLRYILRRATRMCSAFFITNLLSVYYKGGRLVWYKRQKPEAQPTCQTGRYQLELR